MSVIPTKKEILDAVAKEYRNDLFFMEELNSLTWSLKVCLKAKPKTQSDGRMD